MLIIQADSGTIYDFFFQWAQHARVRGRVMSDEEFNALSCEEIAELNTRNFVDYIVDQTI